MSFLFGKKRVQALAEVLEDGRAVWLQEVEKDRKKVSRSRKEPMLEIAVRVLPEYEPPFEAIMKAGLYSGKGYLLQPGVKVLVEYKLGQEQQVTLVDDDQSIYDRNPQLLEEQ